MLNIKWNVIIHQFSHQLLKPNPTNAKVYSQGWFAGLCTIILFMCMYAMVVDSGNGIH